MEGRGESEAREVESGALAIKYHNEIELSGSIHSLVDQRRMDTYEPSFEVRL